MPIENTRHRGIPHPPETRARFRAELVIEHSPRRVAKKMGLPLSTCTTWAAELFQEEAFRAEMATYNQMLEAEAYSGFAVGLEKLVAIAEDETVPTRDRVLAASALLKAPADLARSRSEMTLKLEQAVTLEDLDAMRARLAAGGDVDDAKVVNVDVVDVSTVEH